MSIFAGRFLESARSRDVGKDLAWSGGGNLLTLVTRLGSFLMLGRRLGPADYGAYIALYGILNPIGGLSFHGLGLAVIQRAIRDQVPIPTVVRSYTALTAVQSALAVAAAVSVAALLLDGLGLAAIVAFAVLELVLAAVVNVSAALVHVTESFRAAARIRMGAVALRVSTLAVLFFAGELSIVRLAMFSLVSVGAFVVYLVCVRLPRAGIPLRVGRPALRDVVLGAQLSSALFSQSLKSDGDKTVLSANGMDRDAGIYTAGYRIVQLGLMPVLAVQQAVSHRFLYRGPGAGAHMRRALRYTAPMVSVSLVLVVVMLLAAPAAQVLLGNEFEEAGTVVRWLAPLLPIVVLGQAPSNGLGALDKVGLRTAIVMFVSVVSLVGYVAFIPGNGWEGAAAVTLGSEALLATLLWTAFIRCERSSRRAAPEAHPPASAAGGSSEEEPAASDRRASVRDAIATGARR